MERGLATDQCQRSNTRVLAQIRKDRLPNHTVYKTSYEPQMMLLSDRNGKGRPVTCTRLELSTPVVTFKYLNHSWPNLPFECHCLNPDIIRPRHLHASLNGLLTDPHALPPVLSDRLEMVVVLGPSVASKRAALLLGPTDILSPVAGVTFVGVGQAV